MKTQNRFSPSLNGRAGNPGKAKRTSMLSARTVSRSRLAITVGLGCAIPLLSLYLAAQGGSLLSGGRVAVSLGIGCLSLCCASLGLSLSHLAAAIGEITKCGIRPAWALAVVLDCSLVVSELSNAAGHGCLLVWGFMATVTAASMVLNCWAFLRAK